jgi:hypothetical protein
MKDTELIERLIQDIDSLSVSDLQTLDALQRRADMIIRNVFGESSHYLHDLWGIEFLWPSPTPGRPHRSYYPDKTETDAAWRGGVERMRNLFQTMLEEREHFASSRGHDSTAQITMVKAKLEQKAKRWAQFCLCLIFGLVALLWICSVAVVLLVDWNALEPWIWIVDGMVTIVSFGYFVITHKSLRLEAIYNQIAETRRQKLYRDFGLE